MSPSYYRSQITCTIISVYSVFLQNILSSRLNWILNHTHNDIRNLHHQEIGDQPSLSIPHTECGAYTSFPLEVPPDFIQQVPP